MRVLAVADTTEGWLEDFRDVGAVDLVLSLGDMYLCDLKRLTTLGAPVAGVYGNHCRRGYLDEIGMDLSRGHAAAWSNGIGVRVLGVSGCVRYNNAADHQWTQEEYAEYISRLPAADWVVTHCPPEGVNDDGDPAHLGITALREYIDRFRPTHLFHGHTYPDQPLRSHGSTQVHYVHGWELIEVA